MPRALLHDQPRVGDDLYNEHLQGWKKLHRRAQAEGGAARTETVWLNYVPETGGKVYETV